VERVCKGENLLGWDGNHEKYFWGDAGNSSKLSWHCCERGLESLHGLS
jgi:hypothetical protein